MENTFLTQPTKEYLKRHKFNEVLTEGANEIIRTLPENPWLMFIETFNKNLSLSIQVLTVSVLALYDNSFNRYFKFTFVLLYKTKIEEISFCVFPETHEDPKNPFVQALKAGDDFSSSMYSHHELQRILKKCFEGKETSAHSSWKECLEELSKSSQEAFALLYDSFQWLHYEALNKFEPLTIRTYCKSICKLIPDQPPMDTGLESYLMFSLLKKSPGPQKSSKTVYFMAAGSSELEQFRIARDFFELAKQELSANKATGGKLSVAEGSIVNPFDSLAETLKVLNEVVAKFSKKESLRIWLAVDSLENFDQSASKFTIDGSKKPLGDEEYEDFLVKLFSEKKIISGLIDPFPLTLPMSWHRFNKKAKEKGLTFSYATQFGAQYDSETFLKLEQESFPTIKPDVFAKIQESKASITDAFLLCPPNTALEEALEKVKVLKDQANLTVHFPLQSVYSDMKKHYYRLAQDMRIRLVVSPTDAVFVRSIINEI